MTSDYLKTQFDSSKPADKETKQKLIDGFFTKHGLGDKLRGEYDKVIKILTLPKYLQECYDKMEQEKEGDDRQDEVLYMLKDNFADNKLCIFPSFFKFLVYLRKQKIEFGIVLRTFDADLSVVVNELGW